MSLWQSDKTDEEKLDILLSHTFDEIKKDPDLIVTLLQLSANYFNLPHSTCEKDHFWKYNKLKTLQKKSKQ